MIKAILFDLDNTLIDFWKMKSMSVEAAIRAMQDAGLNINHETAKLKLYALYNELGYEYKYIFEKFLEQVNGKINWKILSNAIVAYRRVRSGFLEPYPRVTQTLLKLVGQGYKLGIVTDAPSLNAWIRLTRMNLDDFFDVVIGFDDTKQLKPSELPFKAALNRLKVNAKEVLMVGDNIKRDISGAKKLGMKTAFAKYGYVESFLSPERSKLVKKFKADFELSKFEDLLEIVKKI